MSDGELIYFIGVITAFATFAVTLAIVSHGEHLPPAGDDTNKVPPSPAVH